MQLLDGLRGPEAEESGVSAVLPDDAALGGIQGDPIDGEIALELAFYNFFLNPAF
ncbi:MAG: hypothetical protein V3R46_00425 [Thermoplasmata archaeon]